MDRGKNFVRILYWNANGIYSRLFQLYDFLCENFVDICCISETHLKLEIHLHSHPEFRIYRLDRIDARLGGVLIIVRRSIKHELLPSLQTSLLENIGIEVICSRRKFHVYSCYNPGGSSNSQIRSFLNADLNKMSRRNASFLSVGDFNAKHRSWNCDRANLSGSILFDNAFENQCFVLHPNEPTHFPVDPNKSPSTIDLILTNGHLQLTDPYTTVCLGSDHNGVIFDVKLDESLEQVPLGFKPSYKDTDWVKYKSLVEQKIMNDRLHLADVTETHQIDQFIVKFTTVLQSAQKESVPMKHQDKCGLELAQIELRT